MIKKKKKKKKKKTECAIFAKNLIKIIEFLDSIDNVVLYYLKKVFTFFVKKIKTWVGPHEKNFFFFLFFFFFFFFFFFLIKNY